MAHWSKGSDGGMTWEAPIIIQERDDSGGSDQGCSHGSSEMMGPIILQRKQGGGKPKVCFPVQ